MVVEFVLCEDGKERICNWSTAVVVDCERVDCGIGSCLSFRATGSVECNEVMLSGEKPSVVTAVRMTGVVKYGKPLPAYELDVS